MVKCFMFGSATASSSSPSQKFPSFCLVSLDSDPSASRSPRPPVGSIPGPSQYFSIFAPPVTPVEATLTQSPANIDYKQLTNNLSPLDATLTKNRGGASSSSPSSRRALTRFVKRRNCRNSNPLMPLLHNSRTPRVGASLRVPERIVTSLFHYLIRSSSVPHGTKHLLRRLHRCGGDVHA